MDSINVHQENEDFDITVSKEETDSDFDFTNEDYREITKESHCLHSTSFRTCNIKKCGCGQGSI